jgi:hypothetical protein
MEPAYHQLEFDTRLWLTALALEGDAGSAAPLSAAAAETPSDKG